MKKIELLMIVLFSTNQPTKASCHVNLGFTICLQVDLKASWSNCTKATHLGTWNIDLLSNGSQIVNQQIKPIKHTYFNK